MFVGEKKNEQDMPPRPEIVEASAATQPPSTTEQTVTTTESDPKIEYDTVTVTKYVNVPIIEATTRYYKQVVERGYAPLPKPIDSAVSPWMPVAPRPQFKMYYRADEGSVCWTK